MPSVMENIPHRRRRRAQSTTEYILVFAALLGAVWCVAILIRTIRQEDSLIQEAVSSEYP
mgnify:CR=1 FL=1